MTDPERTIAAQATAAGQGAIAVIRMSGPGCMDILKQCTPAAFTERLRPRRATLVRKDSPRSTSAGSRLRLFSKLARSLATPSSIAP